MDTQKICTSCEITLSDVEFFCPQCGKPASTVEVDPNAMASGSQRPGNKSNEPAPWRPPPSMSRAAASRRPFVAVQRAQTGNARPQPVQPRPPVHDTDTLQNPQPYNTPPEKPSPVEDEEPEPAGLSSAADTGRAAMEARVQNRQGEEEAERQSPIAESTENELPAKSKAEHEATAQKRAKGKKGKSSAKKHVVQAVVSFVVLAIVVVAFVLWYTTWQKENARQTYDALYAGIVSASTPAEVVQYRSELDIFYAEHQDMVDDELYRIVKISEAYENEAVSEEKYITAISGFLSIESEDSNVQNCALRLERYVQAEYAELNFEPPVEVEPVVVQFIDQLPLVLEGDVEFVTLEASVGYSFTARNTSGKTITYFEALAYCYDDNGNPVLDDRGDNWFFFYHNVNIAPDEYHTPDEDGYWDVGIAGTSRMYIYISYIRYEDGTSGGIWLEDERFAGDYTPYWRAVNEKKLEADTWAAAFADTQEEETEPEDPLQDPEALDAPEIATAPKHRMIK